MNNDFQQNDRIYCVGGSHKGRTALVNNVGKNRLSVTFEDKNYKGYFVKKTHAIAIDNDHKTKGDYRPPTTAKATSNNISEIKHTSNYKIYAVARGRIPGIYDNWPDCEQ